MNLNFNFDGKTLLRNWWKIVEANFRTIQAAFADHLNKFNEHKTAAELDHPDKSVKQRHIDDYSINTTKLAQYAVTNTKIYPGAVQTAHIKDGNVTESKLSQELRDLITELQSYSQTITLTFQDFDKTDAKEFYCGKNSRRVEQDGWVYWQSGTNEVYSGGTYGDYLQAFYYFAGLGAVSKKADAQKPIERLIIKTDFGMTSGTTEIDGSNDIKLYRVTENMSPIDRECGEVIPASEYQVINKRSNYLEVIFFKPITLQELSVAADIGIGGFIPDFDSNDNPIPIEAYPSMGFKAIVKNENPLDTELSTTSANGVENRAITAGIDAAAGEIKGGLYGDTAKYTIMSPKEIPELDDDNNITIDTSRIKLFDEDRDISGSWEYPEYKFRIDTISNNYIYMKYDAELGTIMLSNQDEKLPEGVFGNGDFVVLLYVYGSKSEAIFTFERFYGSENADSTGKTYTVKIGTAEQKNISDLDGHISFLEAANSHTESITRNKNNISRLTSAVSGIEERMVLTADDTDSLSSALTSIKDTGGKVILTGNTPIRMPDITLTADKQYIIEGENRDVNLAYIPELAVNDSAIIVFRNLTVTFATTDSRNFVFDNCNIKNSVSYAFCNNAVANLTFLNCAMTFTCPKTMSVANYSIIQNASEVIIDNHCRISIDAGYAEEGVTLTNNYNFIMRCANAVITNSNIETSGDRLRCYLFGRGTYRITNNTISLNDKGNSLFRNVSLDGDETILSNNHIVVNQDTYIKAGVVTSNVFNVLNPQTADSCFKLLKDGIITDCTFLGSYAYIDCQENLCIIKDNFFGGNTHTITNADESSIIKDNI